MKRVSDRSATRGKRIVAALLVGLAASALVLTLRLSGRSNFSDFDQAWIAVRAAASGHDPYHAVLATLGWPFFYPMTAGVVALPFAALSVVWAHAAWVALSVGLLAYGLTGRGWWALACLMNYPVLNAIELGQWSPILTAAALLPGLAWIAIAKPTTGLAVIGAYASRRMVIPALVACWILVASFLLWRSWVPEWIATVRGANHFVPLALRPGGVVLLLALLKWRRPDARVLAFLALVPQTAAMYEAVPLVLVLSSRAEAMAFGVLSLCAVPFLWHPGVLEFSQVVAHNATVLLFALYVPCLVMVLRRPNVALHGGKLHRM